MNRKTDTRRTDELFATTGGPGQARPCTRGSGLETVLVDEAAGADRRDRADRSLEALGEILAKQRRTSTVGPIGPIGHSDTDAVDPRDDGGSWRWSR